MTFRASEFLCSAPPTTNFVRCQVILNCVELIAWTAHSRPAGFAQFERLRSARLLLSHPPQKTAEHHKKLTSTRLPRVRAIFHQRPVSSSTRTFCVWLFEKTFSRQLIHTIVADPYGNLLAGDFSLLDPLFHAMMMIPFTAPTTAFFHFPPTPVADNNTSPASIAAAAAMTNGRGQQHLQPQFAELVPANASGINNNNNNHAADSRTPIVAMRYRTRMCYNIAVSGTCEYQTRCMFAHSAEELRTPAMNLRDGLTSEAAVRKFQRDQHAANRGTGGVNLAALVRTPPPRPPTATTTIFDGPASRRLTKSQVEPATHIHLISNTPVGDGTIGCKPSLSSFSSLALTEPATPSAVGTGDMTPKGKPTAVSVVHGGDECDVARPLSATLSGAPDSQSQWSATDDSSSRSAVVAASAASLRSHCALPRSPEPRPRHTIVPVSNIGGTTVSLGLQMKQVVGGKTKQPEVRFPIAAALRELHRQK